MWFFSWHTPLLTWKSLLAIHPFLWQNCWEQKKVPSTRCQLLYFAFFILLHLLPWQQIPPPSNNAGHRQRRWGLCAQIIRAGMRTQGIWANTMLSSFLRVLLYTERLLKFPNFGGIFCLVYGLVTQFRIVMNIYITKKFPQV